MASAGPSKAESTTPSAQSEAGKQQGAGEASNKNNSKAVMTPKNGLPVLPLREPSIAPAEAFGEALLKRSVASLCLSAGFDVAEGGALAALSAFCQHKIEELGLNMKRKAEASKRKMVKLEDFAEVVPSLTESILVPSEPFQVLSGVPTFPYEPIRTSKRTTLDSSPDEVTYIEGLRHLPPLPPAHTYKRTKREPREPTQDEIAQFRREQQKSSALVRESLAKMRERHYQ